MYLCICKGITEEQFETAFEHSGGNFKDVCSRLGVGTDCGICVEDAYKKAVTKRGHGAAELQSAPKINQNNKF
ncbi:MAG: (2Fe-2S)-binding protein [Bacteriovoracaceae bacterium]|nr:(2Fe-2S)-binding protein [Bacteriovoracaceae bacterium]